MMNMKQDQEKIKTLLMDVVDHAANFFTNLEHRAVTNHSSSLPTPTLPEVGEGAQATLQYFTKQLISDYWID